MYTFLFLETQKFIPKLVKLISYCCILYCILK